MLSALHCGLLSALHDVGKGRGGEGRGGRAEARAAHDATVVPCRNSRWKKTRCVQPTRETFITTNMYAPPLRLCTSKTCTQGWGEHLGSLQGL